MRNVILLVAVLAVVLIAGTGCDDEAEIAANRAAHNMDIEELENGAVIWTDYDSSGHGLWKVELQATNPRAVAVLSVRSESPTAISVRAVFTQLTGETNWDMGFPKDQVYDVCYEFESYTRLGIRVHSHVNIPKTFRWERSPLSAGPPSGRTRYFTATIVAEEYPAPTTPKTELLPANKAEKE